MSVIKFDQNIFEEVVEKEKKDALVEFWAPWCVYCRRIGPAFEKIADEYEGSLAVGQINIDDNQQLAEQFEIEVVPTLIYFKDGQAVGSIVAPDSKGKIVDFIKENA